MKRFIQFSLILVFFLLAAWGSRTKVALAATRTAKTCSQQDVQTAINAAQDGDTVVVPAGTSEYKTTIQVLPP